MDLKIQEVTGRIRALREDLGISMQEMAAATGRSLSEYAAQESGERDLSFTFLYKASERLGVDVVELLTGENPRLARYAITRAGEGISIKRHAGFEYLHKASELKGKLAEPFVVTVPFDADAVDRHIHMSNHDDQEIEYVLSGHMRFAYEEHTEELFPGDLVMFDATRPHGMIALDGEPLVFIAIVIKDPGASAR